MINSKLKGMNYMDTIKPPKPSKKVSSPEREAEAEDDSEDEEDDEDDDSSFFTWFDATNKDKEFGDKISGDFWQDPVQYFQQYFDDRKKEAAAAAAAENNAEESKEGHDILKISR